MLQTDLCGGGFQEQQVDEGGLELERGRDRLLELDNLDVPVLVQQTLRINATQQSITQLQQGPGMERVHPTHGIF